MGTDQEGLDVYHPESGRFERVLRADTFAAGCPVIGIAGGGLCGQVETSPLSLAQHSSR